MHYLNTYKLHTRKVSLEKLLQFSWFMRATKVIKPGVCPVSKNALSA